MIELTRAKEHLIGWGRLLLLVPLQSLPTSSCCSSGLRGSSVPILRGAAGRTVSLQGLSTEHSIQLLNTAHQFASSFTQDPATTDTTASLLLAAVCSSAMLQVLILVLCLQISLFAI